VLNTCNKNEIDLELQIFLAGQNSHILEYSSVVVLIITKERNRERERANMAGGGPVPSSLYNMSFNMESSLSLSLI